METKIVLYIVPAIFYKLHYYTYVKGKSDWKQLHSEDDHGSRMLCWGATVRISPPLTFPDV